MLSNEFAPLIGIGFGIPQISFAGIYPIPNVFFTIAMADLLILFLVLYILRYKEMKYALFTFPILIFLFNYRLFSQYLFYWTIISLVPMLDCMSQEDVPHNALSGSGHQSGHFRKTRYSRITVALMIAAIIGSAGLGYHESVQNSQVNFTINSVAFTGYNSSGYVDRMNVTMEFHGMSNQTPVFFRVFTDEAIINGNMFLWSTVTNISLTPGQIYNITIMPQYPEYAVNASVGMTVVAYYGSMQGSYHLRDKDR